MQVSRRFCHLELRADHRGGVVRLGQADVRIAAGRAARQRQDMEHIVIGIVLGQRAAAADLDVVGMGADRQHALLLATAARAASLASSRACSMNSADARRPEQQAVDTAADRLAQELRLLIVGGDQRCGPAVVVLDIFEQREAAGRDRRIHRDEIVGLGRQQAHRGLRGRRDFQRGIADGVECAPQHALSRRGRR